MRAPAILFSIAIATAAFSQDQSSDTTLDSFDIEPPLLVQPGTGNQQSNDAAESNTAENVDISKLEKNLERAKAAAAIAERLCKIGVLSKVEVEQRGLRVARLEFELENARLAQARTDLDAQQARLKMGEVSKEQLADFEAAVARANEAAQAAAAKRARAELEAAQANVQRLKKLLAFGIAGKSDVARAEQKLAELKSKE
jgi:hypothetical protein